MSHFSHIDFMEYILYSIGILDCDYSWSSSIPFGARYPVMTSIKWHKNFSNLSRIQLGRTSFLKCLPPQNQNLMEGNYCHFYDDVIFSCNIKMPKIVLNGQIETIISLIPSGSTVLSSLLKNLRGVHNKKSQFLLIILVVYRSESS